MTLAPGLVGAFCLFLALAFAGTTAAAVLVMDVKNLRSQLRDERRRVSDLTTLLMARAAPAEYAAFMDPTPPEAPELYRFSDDGLVATPWSSDADAE